MDDLADKAIRTHFNSRSRKIRKAGSSYLVPLKYDDAGAVLTEESVDIRKHLKRLSLNDWRFLECWRRHEWNVTKATEELSLTEDQVKRLVKKLQPFQQEESRDKALASIITPSKILTRHWDNSYTDELTDGKRDSLKEAAKIVGAYKNNTQINIQNNVFQMPVMSPEEMQKLKDIGDNWTDAEVINA